MITAGETISIKHTHIERMSLSHIGQLALLAQQQLETPDYGISWHKKAASVPYTIMAQF